MKTNRRSQKAMHTLTGTPRPGSQLLGRLLNVVLVIIVLLLVGSTGAAALEDTESK